MLKTSPFPKYYNLLELRPLNLKVQLLYSQQLPDQWFCPNLPNAAVPLVQFLML